MCGTFGGMQRTSPARTVTSRPSSVNFKRAFDDARNLFVMVMMRWDDASLLEHDAREHHLLAGDQLPREQRVHLLDFGFLPAVELFHDVLTSE